MVKLGKRLEQHQFCYLTTRGRMSGRPHRIEIWSAIIDGRLFVNSGGGKHSDWVKSLLADPSVGIEIGDEKWEGTAAVRAEATVHPARPRLAARCQGWRPGQPLSTWATESLLIELRADSGG